MTYATILQMFDEFPGWDAEYKLEILVMFLDQTQSPTPEGFRDYLDMQMQLEDQFSGASYDPGRLQDVRRQLRSM